jgi:hypothetical protein
LVIDSVLFAVCCCLFSHALHKIIAMKASKIVMEKDKVIFI